MIKPHGSEDLLPRLASAERAAALRAEAERLPSLVVSSAAAANAVMLASGYFTPLPGYMSLDEARSVADEMKLLSGLFWPVPVLNVVRASDLPEGLEIGGRLALRDPNVEGAPLLAVMKVESIDTLDDDTREHITERVYGTTDREHPGVKTFAEAGDRVLGGTVDVLGTSYFGDEFPDTFRTAGQIRDAIEKLGWQRVVAFQTRNPMHRAHEALCKMAMEAVSADGVLIHMLLGKLKPGDIPAAVRDAAIRELVDGYFPAGSVMIAGYGFDMLYAGPREALLHAVFRQNAGCTHLIVGRDHAGVGSYYGAFDAQEIFETLPAGALEIQIFAADHTAYSKKLGKVVMLRDAVDHDKSDFVFLSGTKVRDMLSAGEDLPPEFSRPEVSAILKAHYSKA
ncbi:MAG: sulfate adenylyltransferase [Myxococcales bacterium]|nr:sulfate adenylyltransferase [Myxococcales bacterium]